MIHKSSFESVPGNNGYRNLFGQPMQKSWAELMQLEIILNEFKPARIIEFGTGSGTVALYMSVWASLNESEVFTYDIVAPKNEIANMLNFRQKDIFQNKLEIEQVIGKHTKTIIYCDGGDKVRELTTFSKYLKRGDMILTHDYGTEVPMSFDLPDLVEYEPLWFDSWDTKHRAWVKA